MADLGTLSVGIKADVSGLEKDLGKATGLVDKASGKFGNLGGVVAGLATKFNPATLAIQATLAAVVALTAGFVALGAAGKAAFDFANQVDGSMKKLQAQLGATDEQMKGLKQSALNVFGENFGQDINEVGEGIALVEQQIKGLNNAELENITKGVFALRDTFQADLPESVNAIDVLMQQFGLTSQEALDFITAGFQRGLNSSDDFIDTIREYSNLFGESGATASEFFSILETGLQGGVLGTDKVADLFKEFSIRIVDGSKLTGESLAKLGLDAQTLYDQINSGAISTNDAFNMILEDLRGMDDQIVASQIGVGLFGTQFEDLGASAVFALDSAKTGIDSLSGATDSLNVQYDTLGATWEGLLRKAQISLLPIGDILLNSLKKAMPTIEQFFSWFQTTAIPLITDFVGKASDTLFKFFGNFDANFGPSIQRIERSLLMMADALGLTSDGASGLDAIIRVLEIGLQAVVVVVDLWSRTTEIHYRIMTSIINVLRSVYNAIRDIISLVPNFFGSGIMSLSGGRTFQQLTGRAVGGPVTAGAPYVVGEAGPEIFVPETSGQIIPNDAIGGAFKTLAVSTEYLDGLQRIDAAWTDIGQKSEVVLKNQEALAASAKSVADSYSAQKTTYEDIDAVVESVATATKGFQGHSERMLQWFKNYNRQNRSNRPDRAKMDLEALRGGNKYKDLQAAISKAGVGVPIEKFTEEFVNNFSKSGGLTKFQEMMKKGGNFYEDGSFDFSPVGFANGGQFVVPPGYPNDSFLMGVTSGELVTVQPAGRGDTYDNRSVTMNIHTQAREENLLNSYYHAAAAIS